VIDSVIFDWGGTLTPWHDLDPRDAWLAAVDDPGLAARLRAAEDAAWTRCRDQQRSSALDDVFAAAGVTPTDEMLAAFHGWWEPHTYLDPDVPDLFAALRERGIRIGVLSNTLWPREVHQRIFERDGVAELIDGAVYTCEIAWTKPHPEAFHAALSAIGASDPAAAVFVGDRVFDDIHGAGSVGMRTILIPHSDVPTEQIPVAGSPDAVADRLGDVRSIVDSWR
jgi:putative hydrolase of the HAD superfamily